MRFTYYKGLSPCLHAYSTRLSQGAQITMDKEPRFDKRRQFTSNRLHNSEICFESNNDQSVVAWSNEDKLAEQVFLRLSASVGRLAHIPAETLLNIHHTART